MTSSYGNMEQGEHAGQVEVVVTSDGDWGVSEGTQTGDGEVVQITAPLHELMQRIEAFMRLKRQQLDLANQIEFYQSREPGDSCARVNAAYVRRTAQPSHIATQQVHNRAGPNSPPLPPLDQLRAELFPRPKQCHQRRRAGLRSSGLLGLEERISCMERHLDRIADTESAAPRDLLQRVKLLESRLLRLEGHSPEYSHPHKKACKSLPKPKPRDRPYDARTPSSHPGHLHTTASVKPT